MELFFDNDWLNREPPYAFRIEHFMFILLAVLTAIGLSLILRNKSRKTQKWVFIGIWIFGVVIEFISLGFEYARCIIEPDVYKFNIETMLPLHSCSMFMYIFPIAIFSKNKFIQKCAFNFLVVVNMIMGFITLFVGCPGPGYSVFSFPGLITLTYHAIIFFVPYAMVVTRYYDIELWDIRYGLGLFGVLSIIIWTFDAIAGCDYFYFYDGHNFPVLKVISENVHHLVWTLIVMSCYVITAFIIHFLIYGIKYLILKNKEKAEPKPVE